MSLYVSFSVLLYKYFKYLGLAIMFLSLLTHASLLHIPMMLFVMFNWKNSAYVLMNRSDTIDVYTSDRYECMFSDCL